MEHGPNDRVFASIPDWKKVKFGYAAGAFSGLEWECSGEYPEERGNRGKAEWPLRAKLLSKRS